MSVELVIDREGRLVARFQQVTRRTWPSAAGSIALATSVEPDEGLVSRTAAMLAELGYWGLAQVDFVETPSGFTLLDVNPRFYRCLPLAVACGTNLPALWHAVAVGRPVGEPRHLSHRHDLPLARGRLRGRGPRCAGAAVRARAATPAPEPHGPPGDPLPGVLLSVSALASRVMRMLRPRWRTR